MIIPKKFNIAGRTINVRWADTHEFDSDTIGQIFHDKCEIVIGKGNTKRPISDDTKDQVFWHEVVHCILATMEERALNSNEQFVDVMASFIHQVIISSKGELK